MVQCDEVADGLVVGSCPRSVSDVIELRRRHGIDGLLCLQTDEDLERLGLDWPRLAEIHAAQGIEAHHEPVRDYAPDDLARALPRCVARLEALHRAGRTVYVHCTAGQNRAPTVVIAYLAGRCGMSLTAARDLVQSHHVCYPYEEVLAAL